MIKWVHKRFFFTITVVIFLLAIVLRFYQLGSNPPSLTWDEASLGYNAYSILQTGADEYGEHLPLSIRSFDDHKPPLYVYLAVPSVALFGLTEFATRLPSAILGVLTVLLTILFVREVFQRITSDNQSGSAIHLKGIQSAVANPKFADYVALVSGFFMAISPWHLQFSRAAFEGNVGLFFLLFGLYLFLLGMRQKIFFIFSAISFVLCMYSYHSFRLITPLLITFLLLLFISQIKKIKFSLAVFILIVGIGMLPIASSFFSTSGSGSRLSMVSIFTPDELQKGSLQRLSYDQDNNDFIGSVFHNRRVVYALLAVKGYLDHFNPDFLFLHGDGGRQHHAVEFGMVYLWELPFILFGVFSLIFLLNRRLAVVVLLFLIAPLASAMTTGTPHPVRAIAMIPPLHIFTALGVIMAISCLLLVRSKIMRFVGITAIFLGLVINFVYYVHQYYVHTPVEYGDFWQYGHKEALDVASTLEDQYDTIVMTYAYDQPYAYYLFHQKIDPLWYQQNWDYQGTGQVERMRRVIGKYEFRNISYDVDSRQPRTLLIGSPNEIPENAANIIKTIYFLDGSVAFRIVGT